MQIIHKHDGGVVAVLDFKEELAKYKPVLSIDEVEGAIGDEITDMMDLLQYISQQISEKNKRQE